MASAWRPRKATSSRPIISRKAADASTSDRTLRRFNPFSSASSSHGAGLSPSELAKLFKATNVEIENAEEETNREYEAEAILDFKRVSGKPYYYLVKWKGYPTSKNTWEPIDHLRNCFGLIEQFRICGKAKERQYPNLRTDNPAHSTARPDSQRNRPPKPNLFKWELSA